MRLRSCCSVVRFRPASQRPARPSSCSSKSTSGRACDEVCCAAIRRRPNRRHNAHWHGDARRRLGHRERYGHVEGSWNVEQSHGPESFGWHLQRDTNCADWHAAGSVACLQRSLQQHGYAQLLHRCGVVFSGSDYPFSALKSQSRCHVYRAGDQRRSRCLPS
jgi:hypothetical protein